MSTTRRCIFRKTSCSSAAAPTVARPTRGTGRGLTYAGDTGITDAALFGTGHNVNLSTRVAESPRSAAFNNCRTPARAPPQARPRSSNAAPASDPTPSAGVAVLVLYDSLFEFNATASTTSIGSRTTALRSARGGHVVCIVGYDDHRATGSAKNSWGRTGGLRRYYNIGLWRLPHRYFMMYGVVP